MTVNQQDLGSWECGKLLSCFKITVGAANGCALLFYQHEILLLKILHFIQDAKHSKSRRGLEKEMDVLASAEYGLLMALYLLPGKPTTNEFKML